MMSEDENRDNMLRILIATDNHLGVWEKDEIRRDDSFNTFEEILQLAVDNEVDCVLLGGDLFHDNKPSRATLQRTLGILSKFVLGDRPIAFHVLSDQAQNFVAGRVNFEDPNFNVGLPIFTIHGNHDDPVGADGLSAVDLLSTTRLVNYFGKVPRMGSSIGKVRLAPVLLAKGSTQVALYGLGNMRDERLARMFKTPGCVEWFRPASDERYKQEDWFNIFVLHQNRLQHTQSSKNTVKEEYLARFLDFVIWGHEHECILEAWETGKNEKDADPMKGGDFMVLQPGSSVATALSEGESRPKHVQILEISGGDFRLIKLPLLTVRPFIFSNVVLADELEVEPDDQTALEQFLVARVDDACRRAARTALPSAQPVLPLVRLRVDYTGFSTINVQRFGQEFVGKVANPHDVLLWRKATVRKDKGGNTLATANGPLSAEGPQERGVEDLISDHLTHNLKIMTEEELGLALHNFVEKDERGALADCLARTMEASLRAAEADGDMAGAVEDRDIAAHLERYAEQRRTAEEARAATHRAQNGDGDAQSQRPGLPPDGVGPASMDADGGASPSASQRTGRGGRQPTLQAALARSRMGAAAPAAAARAASTDGGSRRGGTQQSQAQRDRSSRAAAGRANARLQTEAAEESSGDDEEEISDAAEDVAAIDLIEDSSEDEAPTPGRGRGRGRAAATTPGAAARRAAGRKRPAPSQAASARESAAAGGAEGGAAVGSFIDSDDEDAAATRRRPAGRALPGSFGRQSQLQGRPSQQASQPGGRARR